MKGVKLLVALLLVSAIIFFSACKKDGPSVFTLVVKAKYGSQNFALNSANTDASGKYVVASSLSFYLSHINLIKTNGTKVNVAELAIFDFSDSSTLSISVPNVQGDFKGISFGCGLDSVQNNANPNDSLFPNPYSGNWNMYWGMLKYRFQVLEAKWDTAVIPVMRNSLVYHTGTNAAYRQTQLNKNFSVCCKPYTLTMYLDMQQVFNNPATGETLNMVTESYTSSGPGDNPVILQKFTDNFSNAFTF